MDTPLVPKHLCIFMVCTSLLAVVGRATELTEIEIDVLVLVDQRIKPLQIGRQASRRSIEALHRVTVGGVVVPVDDGSHVGG